MTDTSKKPRTSGSAVSESTEKSAPAPAFVRLKSLLAGGGDHPGSGLSIPKAGTIFEADVDRGLSLVAAGLAEIAPAGAEEK